MTHPLHMLVLIEYVTWLFNTKLGGRKSFCIFLLYTRPYTGTAWIFIISQILYYFIKSNNALSWHLWKNWFLLTWVFSSDIGWPVPFKSLCMDRQTGYVISPQARTRTWLSDDLILREIIRLLNWGAAHIRAQGHP